LFDKLEVSIRVTLIVSDEDGFDLVRAMISGLNINKSIWKNIILCTDEDTADLEAEFAAIERPKYFLLKSYENDVATEAKK